MKPGSSCLHKKAERMMQFHQLGRPCYSIQRELLIKVVTVGAKHLHQTLIYLHEAIGAGFSRKENGSLSRRRFQTWQSHAENFSAVDASLGAEEDVAVLERPWNALLFAVAVTNAITGDYIVRVNIECLIRQWWESNEFWITRKAGCVLTTSNVWSCDGDS